MNFLFEGGANSEGKPASGWEGGLEGAERSLSVRGGRPDRPPEARAVPTRVKGRV